MDYDKGTPVPVEIVQVAGCTVAGDWSFGRDVRVEREGNNWYIRPRDPKDNGSAMIIINGAEGCNGRLINGTVNLFSE